ncbi:hypothetical protein SGPA1_12083 [Streptomyces misionensis JCM 4497]
MPALASSPAPKAVDHGHTSASDVLPAGHPVLRPGRRGLGGLGRLPGRRRPRARGLDPRHRTGLGDADPARPPAARAGLEDPCLGHPRQRRGRPAALLGLPGAAGRRVQVHPQPQGPAAPQRQVRRPQRQRQVRDHLPRGRGAVRARPGGAGRTPRRGAGTVHPQRSALALRPAVRALRRVRGPHHEDAHRRERPLHRGPRGTPGARPARALLPAPGVGDAARLSRRGPAGARGGHPGGLPLPGREGCALLQRRRRLPGQRPAHRGAGAAARGPAVRRARHPGGGRRGAAAARTRLPAPARRPAVVPAAARRPGGTRTPLPGAGVRRGGDARHRHHPAPAQGPGDGPAGRPGLHRLGPRRARRGGAGHRRHARAGRLLRRPAPRQRARAPRRNDRLHRPGDGVDRPGRHPDPRRPRVRRARRTPRPGHRPVRPRLPAPRPVRAAHHADGLGPGQGGPADRLRGVAVSAARRLGRPGTRRPHAGRPRRRAGHGGRPPGRRPGPRGRRRRAARARRGHRGGSHTAPHGPALPRRRRAVLRPGGRRLPRVRRRGRALGARRDGAGGARGAHGLAGARGRCAHRPRPRPVDRPVRHRRGARAARPYRDGRRTPRQDQGVGRTGRQPLRRAGRDRTGPAVLRPDHRRRRRAQVRPGGRRAARRPGRRRSAAPRSRGSPARPLGRRPAPAGPVPAHRRPRLAGRRPHPARQRCTGARLARRRRRTRRGHRGAGRLGSQLTRQHAAVGGRWRGRRAGPRGLSGPPARPGSRAGPRQRPGRGAGRDAAHRRALPRLGGGGPDPAAPGRRAHRAAAGAAAGRPRPVPGGARGTARLPGPREPAALHRPGHRRGGGAARAARPGRPARRPAAVLSPETKDGPTS